MAWISLFLAGLCEMFGVAMINKLHKDRHLQSGYPCQGRFLHSSPAIVYLFF